MCYRLIPLNPTRITRIREGIRPRGDSESGCIVARLSEAMLLLFP